MSEEVKNPEEAKKSTVTIPGVIAGYTNSIRAIAHCATDHIAHAEAQFTAMLRSVEHTYEVEKDAESGEPVKITFTDRVAFEEFIHRVSRPHSNTLACSLLIFGFSTFDAFLGTLLRTLHQEERSLIHKLEEKTVKVSELLKHGSVEAVMTDLVERDLSSLLRESYDDMFDKLASRHKVGTLKEFDEWPHFIECAQRRNLITHCGGVVNEEYLRKCKAAGIKLGKDTGVGTRLSVSEAYLQRALDLLYGVGVMLAHVLWRTATPDRMRERTKLSEAELGQELYRILRRENWELAKMIGRMAIKAPHPQSDLDNKIIRINYAQALKWSGDEAGAIRVLDETDWSGSIRDLRLGVEALRGNFDKAAELMRQIGSTGEMVDKQGYGDWPVFREFRSSPQFQAAFQDNYREPFKPAGGIADGQKTGQPGLAAPPEGDTLPSPQPPPEEGPSDAN